MLRVRNGPGQPEGLRAGVDTAGRAGNCKARRLYVLSSDKESHEAILSRMGDVEAIIRG